MRQPVIRLRQAALDVMLGVALESIDGLETGGILLGHDEDGLPEITVAGRPGPAAVRTTNRFRRDLSYAQQLSDDAFEADGSVWLGEWHTHPNGPAMPSELDLQSYAKMLGDSELAFSQFLCFIVVPCGDSWSTPMLWPWIVRPSGSVHASAINLVNSFNTPTSSRKGPCGDEYSTT